MDITRDRSLSVPRHGSVWGVGFGAFGTLVGHELAHSVSPDGIRHDATGLLRETWSVPARDEFKSRLRCFENQLQRMKTGPKGPIDGRKVLDEHVADLVGVQIALSAMESDAIESTDSAGRVRRRDFFIAYAQQECGWSGDYLDVPFDSHHAPGRVRINGTLSNTPEFAATFQCASGTPMAPVERCAVW